MRLRLMLPADKTNKVGGGEHKEITQPGQVALYPPCLLAATCICGCTMQV
jgi:hypothetical protein